MVEMTGEKTKADIKLAIDEGLCSDIVTELRRGGFHCISFNTISDIAEMPDSENIAAILAKDTSQIDTFIKNMSVETRSKLLIFAVPDIDSAPLPDDILKIVDAILPVNPHYLTRQLSGMLSLHRKTIQMQDDLMTLGEAVEVHKRKNNEIELLKNAIVRNVSHELRTPLLQVKSAVALIGEDQSDKKLINYAQNAVARLETHVKNITMLGHSLDTNMSPIILRDAIEYARRNLTRIWTRRTDSDRIQIKIEDNLPPIMADKQGLSTVLQLLMDNALKFGEGNDIEVIGRKSGENIYVAIRDTGIGIAEDKLHDIFETFYQVDDSSTRPYGGAGVGLALVKLILENHQVKIHVESTLNQGSTFWFELPAVNFDELDQM